MEDELTHSIIAAATETAVPTRVETGNSPSAELLRDLVRRTIADVPATRIVLFGSAARGEMRADSDLDVLVVVPDGRDCREDARRLYRRFRGFPVATDVLVVAERNVEAHAGNPFLIVHTALAEGKELYRVFH
ncbi:MAG: nucleotidyltransferase domain-containing protein [Planctomycetes bacterium]|nr:nucleotidyltransferase domain-containing protein [Planctomycetota bacterium]